MESKLAAYRAEKQRRWEAEQRQKGLSGLYQAASGLFQRQQRAEPAAEAVPEPPAMESPRAPDSPPPPYEERDPEAGRRGTLDWLITACKVGLYLTLFSIAVHLQFGAVFVLVTAIPIIYFNTSTRGRRPGEVSAYSVFNPNCEAIDGTLTGEQFQREIMYGPGAT